MEVKNTFAPTENRLQQTFEWLCNTLRRHTGQSCAARNEEHCRRCPALLLPGSSGQLFCSSNQRKSIKLDLIHTHYMQYM